MLRRVALMAGLLYSMIALSACVSPPAPPRDTLAPEASAKSKTVTLVVKPENRADEINRRVFSLVNYQGILQFAGPLSVKAYQELGLSGAQQRLATDLQQFEKENDNSDPFTINWSGYSPDSLFSGNAFIGKELVSRVIQDGEEPILLLAYNIGWLAREGKATGVPTNNDEWAELAVAAVQSVNGTDPSVPPKVGMVEIWNEPDIDIYWSGTKEEYYALFNTVAERIHRECPGVKVGGPVAVNMTNPFSLGFVEACGKNMDAFIFHTYGETVEAISGRIVKIAKYIKDKTGRDVPIIITESDNINYRGPEKADYLMKRQFALLGQELAPLVYSFHHFQARGYQEGDRVFGLVEDDGSVIGYNYWPYWMFRDLHGQAVRVEAPADVAGSGLLFTASISETTQSTVLYLTAESSEEKIDVELDLSIPENLRMGMLVVSRMTGDVAGVESVRPLTGQASEKLSIPMVRNEAVTVTVSTKALANPVWATVSFDKDGALAGETLTATLRVKNLAGKTISGKFSILGTPTDWEIKPVVEGQDQLTLVAGQSATVDFSVKTLGTTPAAGSAVYAFASVRAEGERPVRITSIPQRVKVLSPVAMKPVPLRYLATQGESGKITVQITNTFSKAVSGTLEVQMPEGFTVSGAQELSLDVGKEAMLAFDWKASDQVKEGEYQPLIRFNYQNIPYLASYDLAVMKYALGRVSVPVDLSSAFNADGVTYAPAFNDYSDFGARFTMAGEFLPMAGPLSFVGTSFLFPDTSDGKMNMVEMRGQTLPLPQDNYQNLAVLCTSTNSNKKEQLVVKYTDGTSQTIEFAVTDWCVNPKNSEIVVSRAPYRHIPEGVLIDAKPQIFYLSYAIDPSRTVASLVLPDKPTLYILSLSLVK